MTALIPPRNSSNPISALNKKFKKDHKSDISSRRSNLSPAPGHEILGSSVEGKSSRPVYLAAFTDARRLRSGWLAAQSNLITSCESIPLNLIII